MDAKVVLFALSFPASAGGRLATGQKNPPLTDRDGPAQSGFLARHGRFNPVPSISEA